MAESVKALARLSEMTHEGGQVASVSMPLNIATLVLRLSQEDLLRLATQQQELGISVTSPRRNPQVTVRLSPDESSRRDIYLSLCRLFQATTQAVSTETLQQLRVPPALYTLAPALQSSIDLLKSGISLPDTELIALQIHLIALWTSLTDKNNLSPPETIISVKSGI